MGKKKKDNGFEQCSIKELMNRRNLMINVQELETKPVMDRLYKTKEKRDELKYLRLNKTRKAQKIKATSNE